MSEIFKDEKQYLKEYFALDDQRRREWYKYLSTVCNGSSMKPRVLREGEKWESIAFDGMMIQDTILSAMVQGGVPNCLRRKIWLECSGAIHSLTVDSGYYSRLVEKYEGQQSNATHDVEKDLLRSMPAHPYFQQGGEGLNSLRRVLIAYSRRNKLVGYCQSMNFIAAMFLIFMTEEEAFWLLATVIERLVPQYYRKAMVGSLAEQKVFEQLVIKYFPALSKHLEAHNFQIAIVTQPWFLCLFIGYLPLSVVLRVFDCFFYEGSVFLFKVALSMVKVLEKDLLESNSMMELITIFKRREFTAEQILSVTFSTLFVHSIFFDVESKRLRSDTLKKLIRKQLGD